MARFLVDEDVPISISRFLSDKGHDVSLVKDVLLEGTPDPVIAKIAQEQKSIIVTWNVKDFKKEVKKFQFGILAFRCQEPDGLSRLEADYDLIEVELKRVEKDERRFWAEIQNAGIKFYRTDHPSQKTNRGRNVKA